MRRSLSLAATAALASLLAGGCVWVKLDAPASAIRVARADESLQACTRRGEIAVSVKDEVALYRRNPIKVQDELETLARNEAAGLGADTLQPLDEPSAGEQRFAAYVCGAGQAPTGRAPAPRPAEAEGEAETFPIDG